MSFILLSLALTGCGNQTAYCVGDVLAEEQGQGVTDGGFNNPDMAGKRICWSDIVSVSFCKDHNGEYGLADDYGDGGGPFCEEMGYPVSCGNGLYMPTEEECP